MLLVFTTNSPDPTEISTSRYFGIIFLQVSFFIISIYIINIIFCSALLIIDHTNIRSKSKAKMVNTAFAGLFTWGCKFESKWGIYHLCLIFNLSLHFFAPNLH